MRFKGDLWKVTRIEGDKNYVECFYPKASRLNYNEFSFFYSKEVVNGVVELLIS